MTNDDELAARTRRLRDHAQAARHHHTEVGFNWRMDGVQGAVLSVKLPHLDAWNSRRREIAAKYFAGLQGAVGLTFHPERDFARAIWHVFPVFHANREALRTELDKRGIQTGVHYPTPVHLQPVYAYLGLHKGALPVSERLASTEVSLPMYAEMTDAMADEVIREVKAACEVVRA
jgi:dTDP-4-amino-4,6-dideoxygalactose transaminase